MINNLNAIGIKTKFEYLKYAAFRDKVQDGGSPLILALGVHIR